MSWQVLYTEGRNVELVGTEKSDRMAFGLIMQSTYKIARENFEDGDMLGFGKYFARFMLRGAGFDWYAWRVLEGDSFESFCGKHTNAFEAALDNGIEPGSGDGTWMVVKTRHRKRHHMALFAPTLDDIAYEVRRNRALQPYKDLQVYFLAIARNGQAVRCLIRRNYQQQNPCLTC